VSLGKTPWVDRTLSSVWDRIVAASPRPEWVPSHEVLSRGRVSVEEYGCGHYGCVMPTSDPEVVCKLTSDQTEGAFIAAAMELGSQPEGLVQYHAIYAIPDVSHRKRPLFVLWREAAHDVGRVESKLDEKFPGDANRIRYEHQSMMALHKLLRFYRDAAAGLRDTVKRAGFGVIAEAERYLERAREAAGDIDWDTAPSSSVQSALARYRGPERVALAMATCESLHMWMGNTYGCDLIGGALEYYYDNGMLLADVHAGNIGRTERTGFVPVITDPGHAVPLSTRWANISVPRLP
jgi:hypothetical protein